jgi:hypothetical protein
MVRTLVFLFVVSSLVGCGSPKPAPAQTPIAAPAKLAASATPTQVVEGPPNETPLLETGEHSECRAACSGTANAELIEAIARSSRKARKCYERELAQSPELTVVMRVALRVGAAGKPCSVTIATTDHHVVADCVAENLREVSLPAATNGCVDVIAPLRFLPR